MRWSMFRTTTTGLALAGLGPELLAGVAGEDAPLQAVRSNPAARTAA